MKNTAALFSETLKQGLQMATVNYFDGVVNAEVKSSYAPVENTKVISITDYRKQFDTNPVLYWGEDNKLPFHMAKEADASSVFQGAYKILTDHMRGQSLGLAIPKMVGGQRILEPYDNEEIMDELYDIGYYEYWHATCGELPMWGNIVPVYKLNKARDIKKLQIFDGTWNRLQKPSPTNGRIQNMYVSAQWEHDITQKMKGGEIPPSLKNWVSMFPLLDQLDYVSQMELMKKEYTFVSHYKYHTSGQAYGRAPWHSLYVNRWLGISGKVPEMIMRFYDAAMTINYLFYINSEWLQKKFVGIEDWDDDKRAAKIAELQASYEKNLKGSGNAFKAMMLTFNYDQNGKEQKNLLIEVMDNKMIQKDLLPDSQLSDGQVAFTLGVDPALLGLVLPGGSKGGGSGSPIREASLALQMRLKSDRSICHMPFYVWRDYKYRKSKDKLLKKVEIVTNDYLINGLDGRAPTSAKETTPAN